MMPHLVLCKRKEKELCDCANWEIRRCLRDLHRPMPMVRQALGVVWKRYWLVGDIDRGSADTTFFLGGYISMAPACYGPGMTGSDRMSLLKTRHENSTLYLQFTTYVLVI